MGATDGAVVFTGGAVFTGHGVRSRPGAVAVRGGRIVAVGAAAAGTRLAAGSDWSVSSPNPLWGAHVAVNRTPPDGNAEPFLPGQALDLATILTAYTAGSAYVNHLDHRTGTIEVGRSADLAILDRDPFDHPAAEIGQARVTRTYVDGELVYTAGG